MKYINRNWGPNARPLLQSQIEEAQSKSKSASGAARYLNVSYLTYRKYAKLYGIFENHKNPRGFGITKGPNTKCTVKIEDILSGKNPNYDINRLKTRLLRGNYLEEECMRCHFRERRFTDHKVPLIMNFRDSNPKNKKLTNLELLCYNCSFLMYGRKHKQNVYTLDSELDDAPRLISQIAEATAKSYNGRNNLTLGDELVIIPDMETDEIPLDNVEMSSEEIQKLKEEINSENK